MSKNTLYRGLGLAGLQEAQLQDSANRLAEATREAGDDDKAGNANLLLLFAVLRAKLEIHDAIAKAKEMAA